MSANTPVPQVVRNYLMISASVVLMSMGFTDLFYSPTRLAQQDRIDHYSNYMKAGLVMATRNTLKAAQ